LNIKIENIQKSNTTYLKR